MDSISSLEASWYILIASWLIAVFSAALLKAFTVRHRWTHRSIFLGTVILALGCICSMYARGTSHDAGTFLGPPLFWLLVLCTAVLAIIGFSVGITYRKDWADSRQNSCPQAAR